MSKQTLRVCLVIDFVFYFQKLIFGNIKKKTILLYLKKKKKKCLVSWNSNNNNNFEKNIYMLLLGFDL